MKLATNYIETWAAGDRAALAGLVTDDVDFAGPMARAQGREAFLDTVLSFTPHLRGVRILHVCGDDADAVILYAMDTDVFGTIPAAEHVRFRGDRLAWSRLIFDTHPLRESAGGAGQQP